MAGFLGIPEKAVTSLDGIAEGIYEHVKEEGIEVPFLVNNAPKWISGIVAHTSCGDVVKALLAAEGRLKGMSAEQFVLVERWRSVEQPLRKDSHMLNIWQAWGCEAKDVQFILKKVKSKKQSKGKIKMPKDSKKTQSDSYRRGGDLLNLHSNIKSLLKIIVSQRNTIQTQLKTLQSKDSYLRSLDKSLSCSDGRDYVMQNYLDQIPEHVEVEESQEESQDSGCGSGNDMQESCNEAHFQETDYSPLPLVVNENPLHPKTDHGTTSISLLSELLERLYHLNKKLEYQEEEIYNLTHQMEGIMNDANGSKQNLSPEQESVLHNELVSAKEELQTMSKLNSQLSDDIKKNEVALTSLMENFSGRKEMENKMIIDVEVQNFVQHGIAGLTYFKNIEVESEDDEDSEIGEMTCGSKDTNLPEHSQPTYPVLAPPEEFQNCLSPSAKYEGRFMEGRKSASSPANSNDSLSSTATEKSVRFNDRDFILSTPEPSFSLGPITWLGYPTAPPGSARPEIQVYSELDIKSILKFREKRPEILVNSEIDSRSIVKFQNQKPEIPVYRDTLV